MNQRTPWVRPGVLALTLASLLAAGGCAIAERAEALYLRQQSAQGALATTLADLESARPALARRLYRLEDELHDACRPLREAGQRRFEGQDVEPGLELAVATALNQCESTTGVIERLVQQAKAGDLNGTPELELAPNRFGGQ